MTTRQFVWGMLVIWVALGFATVFMPQEFVFDYLTSMGIAAGLIVILVFTPVVVDAWRSEGSLQPGHMLALGIVANWTGLAIRLQRFYVSTEHPAWSAFPSWAYNFGLWLTLTASGLMVGSVALTDPPWTAYRMWAIFGLWVVLSSLLLVIARLAQA